VKTFCSSIAETVNSRNNVLYVRFFADWTARNSTFSSLYTAYRERKKDGENDGKRTEQGTFETPYWDIIPMQFGTKISGQFY
jgi:hypothetical protein